MTRKQITYSGNVQGVGFRWKVLQISKLYSITGYVQNLTNGKVELLAEGQDDQVEEMIKKVARELNNYWVTQEHEDKPGESHFENFLIKEY
jgi:acylphosphatase